MRCKCGGRLYLGNHLLESRYICVDCGARNQARLKRYGDSSSPQKSRVQKSPISVAAIAMNKAKPISSNLLIDSIDRILQYRKDFENTSHEPECRSCPKCSGYAHQRPVDQVFYCTNCRYRFKGESQNEN